MENKKPDSNQVTPCEKFVWCKHHHVVVPLVVALLFIGVFMAGLAIGHEFAGDEGGHGERGGWEKSDCNEKGFFNERENCNQDNNNEQTDEKKSRSKSDLQQKNLKINNEAEVGDSVNIDQENTATSTITQ